MRPDVISNFPDGSLGHNVMQAIRRFIDEDCEGNISKASRFFDIDPTNNLVRKWYRGVQTPSFAAASDICGRLGINIEGSTQAFSDEYDFVPKVAAKAGAGSSFEVSGEIKDEYAFRKDFFARYNLQAHNLVLMDVVGDSMFPTLSEGDTVLIDKSDIEVVDGKIYVVAYGDDLKVKRLQRTPRGIVLRSDNRDYADVQIQGDELDSFVVHGRVRWCGKTF